MLKFVGFLTVLIVVFGAGIYVGRVGPETVLTKAKHIGSEVVARTTSLERDLTVRMSLVNAKERLVQAKSDLLDKNFGKAASELGEAAKNLSQAKEAGAADLRGKLDGLTARVSELAADAKAVKPEAPARLEEVVKELDALLMR
jgi:hypothetical protein